MKLALILVFALQFACSSGNSPNNTPEENPPAQTDLDTGLSNLDQEEEGSADNESGSSTSMETTLTCTKGAESKIFTSYTYSPAQACKHPNVQGQNCVCETVNASDGRVWVYAQNTENYCNEALTTLQTGAANSGQFRHAGYETLGYTCTIE